MLYAWFCSKYDFACSLLHTATEQCVQNVVMFYRMCIVSTELSLAFVQYKISQKGHKEYLWIVYQ